MHHHSTGLIAILTVAILLLQTMSAASSDPSISAPVRQTADRISASRALLTSRYPSFLNDPYASLFAAPNSINMTRPTSSLSRIATRTRVFDCFVEDCLCKNYTQVISLGAGYDFRFMRILMPSNVKIWEIDQEEVVTHKQNILEQNAVITPSNLMRVSSDITTLSFLPLCTGFDPRLKTCIIGEGLLYYFDAEKVEEGRGARS